METPSWAQIVSILCLVLYTLEVALELAVGFRIWGQKVNLFIILMGYLEIILSLSVPENASVSLLRALRCVRVIKLLAALRDAGLSSLTQLENILMVCMKDSVGEAPDVLLAQRYGNHVSCGYSNDSMIHPFWMVYSTHLW